MLDGERLRAARLKANLSHHELAERIGTSSKSIWRYETGMNDATGAILKRMAEALNVSVEYLLDMTDNPQPTFGESGLSDKEREALMAWRSGKRILAIKVIADDDPSTVIPDV